MRYREKADPSRSLKDMEKIYGMTEEMLDKASTWFVFPDAKPRTLITGQVLENLMKG